MAQELTDAIVKALPAPASGNRIAYDSEVRGLGVRVTAAGARAWIFNYRTKGGKERRYTIGDAAKRTVKAARKEAETLRRRVENGGDPMGEVHTVRAAPTVNDLADQFEAKHLTKKRPSTVRDYTSILTLYIRPALGSTKVADVRRADIDKLHTKIAQDAPYRANRTVAVLSKMFALAIVWEMRTDNPVIGIERAPEEKRQRFLSPGEITRLGAALASHPERASANAVRLLLLTGARRGEVLGASWDQFDLARTATDKEGNEHPAPIWTKPAASTKTNRDHRIPLSAPALQLLVAMKAESDTENERRARHRLAPIPYLFPGKDNAPLTEIKRFWASVCKTAGITGARIHDLRHTHASILASLGLSLPIIGALLGHTQAATTHRYAHLMDDPLRAATERVGAVVGAAGRTGGDVVPMTGRRA